MEKVCWPIKKNLTFFVVLFLLLAEHTVLILYRRSGGGVPFLCLSALYAYIMTWMVGFSRLRWLKTLLYVVFFLIFFIDVFLAINFFSSISPSTVTLLLETNGEESAGFFSNFMLTKRAVITYVICLLMVCLMVVGERVQGRLIHILSKFRWEKPVGIVLLAVMAYGLYSFHIYFSMLRIKHAYDIDLWIEDHHYEPMDNISNLFYCLYDLQLAKGDQQIAIKQLFHPDMKRGKVATNDSVDVVLIIGESFNKYHSNLYGYQLVTNPYMTEEKANGRLFVFEDAVSPFNLTSKVLRNVFCCNSMGMGEQWSNSPFLPAIFRQAGYFVCFWDNQYNKQSNDSFDYSLNSFLHGEEISRASYDLTNDELWQYDGDAVEAMMKAHQPAKGKQNMVILHLMGQHVDYYCRFPHGGSFDHFNKDSIQRGESYMDDAKRQLIADYDNATLYDDAVLKQVIDNYRNQNAVIVFFPDHGEEVYDFRAYFGRDHSNFNRNILKCDYEVPFFIWCSETYSQRNPEIVERVRQSQRKPFSIDNLCHMLFSLGMVETPYYIPERDVLSDSYECPPRIVGDKFDYDSIMGNPALGSTKTIK